MIDTEHLVIFITASIRKYLSANSVGVPITFLQQGDEKDKAVQDEVQVITSIDLPKIGSRVETYAFVNLQCVVKTKIVPTDVYYHTRVKARLLGILDKSIPLLKIGGEGTLVYDKTQWGYLRRIPSETLRVTPTSIDVPDASLVEAFYEIQTC